ncbi:MAG: hypothetical protein WCG98_09885 [bacterium]
MNNTSYAKLQNKHAPSAGPVDEKEIPHDEQASVEKKILATNEIPAPDKVAQLEQALSEVQ